MKDTDQMQIDATYKKYLLQARLQNTAAKLLLATVVDIAQRMTLGQESSELLIRRTQHAINAAVTIWKQTLSAVGAFDDERIFIKVGVSSDGCIDLSLSKEINDMLVGKGSIEITVPMGGSLEQLLEPTPDLMRSKTLEKSFTLLPFKRPSRLH